MGLDHGHDDHDHADTGHAHAAGAGPTALKFALVATAAIAALEIFGGLASSAQRSKYPGWESMQSPGHPHQR